MKVCYWLVLAVLWWVVCSKALDTRSKPECVGETTLLRHSLQLSSEYLSLVNLVQLSLNLLCSCFCGNLQQSVLHGEGFSCICFQPDMHFY